MMQSMQAALTAPDDAVALGRDLQRDVDKLLRQGGKADRALRELSLQIHNHPELSFNETFAYGLLTKYLEEHGFHVEHHAYEIETAFVATFETKRGKDATDDATSDAKQPLFDDKGTGRGQDGDDVDPEKRKKPLTVAFCSEYDALPEIGHACGHNLIAIAGVAAALATKETMIRHDLHGKVILLGTPAEEGGGGKVLMINRGALKDVDFCMMLHPGGADNSMPPCLAMQSLDFTFVGKAAHAAAQPWEGINALDAMCMGFSHVGMLRQEMRPSNRIHGIITDGGKAPNVIPDRTEAQFIVRSEKLKDLRELLPRVVHCFTAAATATGCQVDVGYQMSYQNILSNMVLKNLYQGFMTEYGVKWPSDEEMASQSAGSTDFGDVSHVVPGLHPMFYVGVPGVEIHTKEFTAAARTEAAHWHTIRAAKALALTALTVLRQPDRYVRKMRKDFERQKEEDENTKTN
ncbi:hypothetical protein RI367_007210 [Sorochytrium milnesiophthora]